MFQLGGSLSDIQIVINQKRFQYSYKRDIRLGYFLNNFIKKYNKICINRNNHCLNMIPQLYICLMYSMPELCMYCLCRSVYLSK